MAYVGAFALDVCGKNAKSITCNEYVHALSVINYKMNLKVIRKATSCMYNYIYDNNGLVVACNVKSI
jgi:hypothetical protein